MGCGRCVVSCPTDALEIRDVRNLFRPNLVQNGSHLMKKSPALPMPRIEPATRAPEERVRDVKEIYVRPPLAEIQKQASRCLDCGVPGCRRGCPLGNRIPDWMQAAARGEFIEAAGIAHATSPLPEICGRLCPQHRLCEGACTRTPQDGAVTIGAIERYVTEIALESGWTPPAPKSRNGRRIAVIGAGPAGLACADFLNREGCTVTVYDRDHDIGGLLVQGVPPFKLERSTLATRHALFENAGIEFKLGVEVDGTMMRRLVEEHDAVFLATGARTPRDTTLPGRERRGVIAALDYLQQPTVYPAKRVLVLGGGDTAMDCARTARRAGAEVTVCARGSEETLRASPREVKAAREEGVGFRFRHTPVHIAGAEAVQSVRFQTPEGESSEACDLVILAFGFVAQPPAWLSALGIETDTQGRVRVDAHGRTTHPKVNAGGDMTRGPDLVVTAAADGRRAAQDMLKSFRPLARTRTGLRALAAGTTSRPAAAMES
jgi:glutamate synthase (NADPH/NADH) small chain